MPVALWQSCPAMSPWDTLYRSRLTCPKRPRTGRAFSSTHSHPNLNTDRVRRICFWRDCRALLRSPNLRGSDGVPCRKDFLLACSGPPKLSAAFWLVLGVRKLGVEGRDKESAEHGNN